MSSTSANVNANVNPVYADVIQVKDMTESGKYHGLTATIMGNIVLRELLKAAADPNVPFEMIEETEYTALEAPVFFEKYNVLNAFQPFGEQAVYDFFKEFVKRGIDDARYYNLIYTI